MLKQWLFFRSKEHRKLMLALISYRVKSSLTFPIRVIKEFKRTRGMSRWELYIDRKEKEEEHQKALLMIRLIGAFTRFKISLLACSFSDSADKLEDDTSALEVSRCELLDIIEQAKRHRIPLEELEELVRSATIIDEEQHEAFLDECERLTSALLPSHQAPA